MAIQVKAIAQVGKMGEVALVSSVQMNGVTTAANCLILEVLQECASETRFVPGCYRH